MKRILLIGSGGLLGNYFLSSINKTDNFEIYSTFLSQANTQANNIQLDIRIKSQCRNVVDNIKPDVIIHAASLGNIDYCEVNKKEALHTNFTGTKNILKAIPKSTKYVYISTSNVYSGNQKINTEEDDLKPVNYYGYTKMLSEKMIKENNKNYIILRPTAMYGKTVSAARKSFAEKFLEEISNGKMINVTSDRYTNFSYAHETAIVIKQLINLDVRNEIVNTGGNKNISYYEFAIRIAKKFKFINPNIIPVKYSYFANLAPRPKNVNLSTKKIKYIIGKDNIENNINFGISNFYNDINN